MYCFTEIQAKDPKQESLSIRTADMDMVWMYSRRERVREINWKLLCLASLVKTNKHTNISSLLGD